MTTATVSSFFLASLSSPLPAEGVNALLQSPSSSKALLTAHFTGVVDDYYGCDAINGNNNSWHGGHGTLPTLATILCAAWELVKQPSCSFCTLV